METAHSSSTPRVIALALIAVLLFVCTGCTTWWADRKHHEATSVVQFLYPDKNLPFVQPQIPTLRLPLRVGVAFVPSGTRNGYLPAAGLDELQKTELLRKVAAQFKSLPFVQSIEIVPATYLRPGGGFENLDQLRALMGIDVVALVAYDQTQISDSTEAALTYWTIVGAYIVEGQRNTTHTMMEAVVYDIPSRSLLFRAPGTSSIKNHATLVRNGYELRKTSAESFAAASAQMSTNLAQELELFKVRAKEAPETVRIEHKPGYTGGGSLDGGAALLVVLMVGAQLAKRRS